MSEIIHRGSISPFDDLHVRGYGWTDSSAQHRSTFHIGTLADVYTGIEQNFSEKRSAATIETFAFSVARLPRAVLQTRMAVGESFDEQTVFPLYIDCLDVCRALYAHQPGSYEKFHAWRQKFTNAVPRSETNKVRQADFAQSLGLYDPLLTHQNAQIISQKYISRGGRYTQTGIGIIPVAFGGLPIGIDIANRLARLHPDSTIDMFPIRYSRDEYPTPFIRTVDEEYIRKISQEKMIVIVDDDCSWSMPTLRRVQCEVAHITGKRAPSFFTTLLRSGAYDICVQANERHSFGMKKPMIFSSPASKYA